MVYTMDTYIIADIQSSMVLVYTVYWQRLWLKPVGLVQKGRQPLGAVLYSSREPRVNSRNGFA